MRVHLKLRMSHLADCVFDRIFTNSLVFSKWSWWELFWYLQGRETFAGTFYQAINFPRVTLIFHDCLNLSRFSKTRVNSFWGAWESFLISRMFVCLRYITLCWCQRRDRNSTLETEMAFVKAVSLFHADHMLHVSSHEPRFNISQTSHCWISLYASNSFTASGLALHWRRHSPRPVGEKLWEWV